LIRNGFKQFYEEIYWIINGLSELDSCDLLANDKTIGKMQTYKLVKEALHKGMGRQQILKDGPMKLLSMNFRNMEGSFLTS